MAIFKIIHVEVSKIFKDGLSLRGFNDIMISNCFDIICKRLIISQKFDKLTQNCQHGF